MFQTLTTEAPPAFSQSAISVKAAPAMSTTMSHEEFAALCPAAMPRVYAYCVSIMRERTSAEDITSQTFERAWSRRSRFNPDRGHFHAWLIGIARNACLDELRKRKRRGEVELDESWQTSSSYGATAIDSATQTISRLDLRAALAELPGKDRELIVLKYFCDLPNAEIARVVGISPSNVSTRLSRLLAQLKEKIDV